jgi:uncharacterized protein
MRFWDASAVVPLFVRQPASLVVQNLLDEMPDAVVWWGTPLECASALARLRRQGGLGVADEMSIQEALHDWLATCTELQPTDRVRATGLRLLRTHPLRTADALQLAAALEWAGTPRGNVFVTLDGRLAEAARLEGFRVAP